MSRWAAPRRSAEAPTEPRLHCTLWRCAVPTMPRPSKRKAAARARHARQKEARIASVQPLRNGSGQFTRRSVKNPTRNIISVLGKEWEEFDVDDMELMMLEEEESSDPDMFIEEETLRDAFVQ